MRATVAPWVFAPEDWAANLCVPLQYCIHLTVKTQEESFKT